MALKEPNLNNPHKPAGGRLQQIILSSEGAEYDTYFKYISPFQGWSYGDYFTPGWRAGGYSYFATSWLHSN